MLAISYNYFKKRNSRLERKITVNHVHLADDVKAITATYLRGTAICGYVSVNTDLTGWAVKIRHKTPTKACSFTDQEAQVIDVSSYDLKQSFYYPRLVGSWLKNKVFFCVSAVWIGGVVRVAISVNLS